MFSDFYATVVQGHAHAVMTYELNRQFGRLKLSSYADEIAIEDRLPRGEPRGFIPKIHCAARLISSADLPNDA